MREPVTIDCEYLAPQLAAAYLVVERGEAAFIETNTARAVPKLLAALASRQLAPEQVRYVVLTHVHLDHAGGASTLLERCPNATLLAHPRAARHVVDPSRLIASARQVYGDAAFEALYGGLGPVDAARVRAVADGEELDFGGRSWRFFHARGHANHHLCLHDSETNGIFTGDAFGLRYPALQHDGLFVFPSTSPTDFDAAAARAAVRRIAAEGERAYLTHFGELTDLSPAAGQLLLHLDASEAILERAIASPEADEQLDAFCERELRRHFASFCQTLRLRPTAADWALMKLDLELNAQGLAHVARRRRAAG